MKRHVFGVGMALAGLSLILSSGGCGIIGGGLLGGIIGYQSGEALAGAAIGAAVRFRRRIRLKPNRSRGRCWRPSLARWSSSPAVPPTGASVRSARSWRTNRSRPKNRRHPGESYFRRSASYRPFSHSSASSVLPGGTAPRPFLGSFLLFPIDAAFRKRPWFLVYR